MGSGSGDWMLIRAGRVPLTPLWAEDRDFRDSADRCGDRAGGAVSSGAAAAGGDSGCRMTAGGGESERATGGGETRWRIKTGSGEGERATGGGEIGW